MRRPTGEWSGYQILSFDLDGTLVDTAAEIAEATHRTLAAYGLPCLPAARISDHIGLGTRELLRRVLEELRAGPGAYAGPPFEEIMHTFDAHYAATAGTVGSAYPGAHEALAALTRARVRLACVSNKELRHATRVLAVNGLQDYFPLIVGGDSLPHKKPHPSVLRHVVASLRGEAAHAAHVGDSHVDVEAARSAGVAAWAVPYGYNAGVPIVAARPDRIFPTLTMLADYVTRSLRTP